MEMKFGHYLVRQEKKTFNAVYKLEYGTERFITHKTSWRQATGVAKILDKAYEEGYEEAKDRYYDEYT